MRNPEWVGLVNKGQIQGFYNSQISHSDTVIIIISFFLTAYIFIFPYGYCNPRRGLKRRFLTAQIQAIDFLQLSLSLSRLWSSLESDRPWDCGRLSSIGFAGELFCFSDRFLIGRVGFCLFWKNLIRG